MPFMVGERPVRQLRRHEVLAMVEAGILTEGQRWEHLDGALVVVNAPSPAHELVDAEIKRWLAALMIAGTHDMRTSGALAVPDDRSTPQPDLAVTKVMTLAEGHPTTSVLTIEVSVSSIGVDSGLKRELYAGARVAEYWVVDVDHREVRILTESDGVDFTKERTARAGDTISPVAVPLPPIAVDTIFRRLDA